VVSGIDRHPDTERPRVLHTWDQHSNYRSHSGAKVSVIHCSIPSSTTCFLNEFMLQVVRQIIHLLVRFTSPSTVGNSWSRVVRHLSLP
jgi:hypothetical protein